MGTAQTIDNLLFASTTALFKAYGVPIAEIAERPPRGAHAPLCAVIGFHGQILAGALMLAADLEPVRRTRPVPSTSDRDWIAELANQLLGRVKNKLLGHGIEVYATTPIVLRGERIAPLGGTSNVSGVLFEARDGGRIIAWVDYEVTDHAQFEKAMATEVAREGDVVLF
ncbi:MAG: chemotaxis protein CheX [Planctomycetes bacterium]|nr:chemotaxis protein CheX [Planctomycetota bacterium]